MLTPYSLNIGKQLAPTCREKKGEGEGELVDDGSGLKRERLVRVEVSADHLCRHCRRDWYGRFARSRDLAPPPKSCSMQQILSVSAVTFPLDIIKTRLQVSRQLHGRPRDGMVRTTARLGETTRKWIGNAVQNFSSSSVPYGHVIKLHVCGARRSPPARDLSYRAVQCSRS